MKKIFLNLILVVIILTAISGIGICQPKIILTTASNVEQVKIRLSGRGKVIIDWGDGTIDRITNIYSFPDSSHSDYYHIYSDTLTRTIKIIGGKFISIICSDNHLTNVDISKNTKLRGLFCNNNQLTNLDVCKNRALKSLDCANNYLTNLDISKNIKLWGLFCDDNQLIRLDLSANPLLYALTCRRNDFSEIALNEMFETLCETKDENKKRKDEKYKLILAKYMYIDGNSGTDSCNKHIAESKGWEIITWEN